MIKNKLVFMMIGIGVLLCTYLNDNKTSWQSTNNFWLGLFVVIVLGLVLAQILNSIRKRREN